MNQLVSAASRPCELPLSSRRVPLTARAAQQAGNAPATLCRVTAAADTVPSVSSFQPAL
ncbi:hypothetical protein ACFYMW_36525 [Streptomyces sp. NPDC006692]|uniref:hypothetical protein n=1 Tax=unclassified Streptomyces TaxID=2593676 RepID=UPI0036D01946